MDRAFAASAAPQTRSRLTRKSYRWYESTQNLLTHPADKQPVAEELSDAEKLLPKCAIRFAFCRIVLPRHCSPILSALAFALDLTEGAVPGHALRSCLLGMRLGMELGFSPIALADLYHALLLKDVGCSSNAARMCQILGGGDDRAVKSGIKLEDWTRPDRPRLSTLRLLWNNVSPEENPMRRLGRILHIGFTQHANNEEMIQLRCDRGASIVRKIGMSDKQPWPCAVLMSIGTAAVIRSG